MAAFCPDFVTRRVRLDTNFTVDIWFKGERVTRRTGSGLSAIFPTSYDKSINETLKVEEIIKDFALGIQWNPVFPKTENFFVQNDLSLGGWRIYIISVSFHYITIIILVLVIIIFDFRIEQKDWKY